MQNGISGDDDGDTTSGGRPPLPSALPIHPLPSRSIGSVLDLGQRNKQCNCKRSNCLKLYCECFAIGIYCNPSICNCVLCWNNEEGGNSRVKAVQSTLERNAHAFRAKLTGSASQSQTITNNATDISKGCNCKKSGCLKKYCECFQQSIECGARCKCKECKNVKGNPEREKIMNGTSPAAYTTPSRKGTPIYRGGTSMAGLHAGQPILPPSYYAKPVEGGSADLVEVALGEGKEGTHYWEKPGPGGAGEWVGGGFRVADGGHVPRKRNRGWLREGMEGINGRNEKDTEPKPKAVKKRTVTTVKTSKPQNPGPVDFTCNESIDILGGEEAGESNGNGSKGSYGNGSGNGRSVSGRTSTGQKKITFRDTATPKDRMNKLRSMIQEIRKTTEHMAVERILAKQRGVVEEVGVGVGVKEGEGTPK
ncbi:hypothetical protein TrLO_g14599 [Triparma laevis f. longispina]|uniref:CRC domain-containing protein n=1 Tax=Triparma laevis f. longispina TaxID=1714387 RepID=A0A9W7E187_9STRA|nr:hypothetical protein TrLO_g14599 [Triparma laevis f. longispina]